MRFLTVLLIIVTIALPGCSRFSKVQKNGDVNFKLKAADLYYAKKQFNYAQQLYEELFPLFKGTPEFEDLYYKYAYCAYHQKDWMNAENLFKTFVETFPNSPRAEEMDYMRASCYYRQSPKPELDQTNTTRTIGLMQTFINTHPNSPKVKEAVDIIDKCRYKLEQKEWRSAQLYYDMGQFRAASIAFTSLMADYPESSKSEHYKLQAIKSFYGYASNSIEAKKEERFTKVISECNDFVDRFPQSSLTKEVEQYEQLAKQNIKALNNEQVKTAA